MGKIQNICHIRVQRALINNSKRHIHVTKTQACFGYDKVFFFFLFSPIHLKNGLIYCLSRALELWGTPCKLAHFFHKTIIFLFVFCFFFQTMMCHKWVRAYMKDIFKPYHTQINPHTRDHKDNKVLARNTTIFQWLEKIPVGIICLFVCH